MFTANTRENGLGLNGGIEKVWRIVWANFDSFEKREKKRMPDKMFLISILSMEHRTMHGSRGNVAGLRHQSPHTSRRPFQIRTTGFGRAEIF